MVKTPVQTEVKPNAYITKPTSKTLLTPCRRMGLSRKRKTPNTSSNTSFSESPSNALVSQNVKTPVSSSELTEAIQAIATKSNIKPTQAPIEKKKSRVSKCLIPDDVPQIVNKNLETQEKCTNSNCEEVNKDKNSEGEIGPQNKTVNAESPKKDKVAKRPISDDEAFLDDPQKHKKSKKKSNEPVTQKEAQKGSQGDVNIQKNKAKIKIRKSPRKKAQKVNSSKDESETSPPRVTEEDMSDFEFNHAKNLKTYQKRNTTQTKKSQANPEVKNSDKITSTNMENSTPKTDCKQEFTTVLDNNMANETTTLVDITEKENNTSNLNLSTKQQSHNEMHQISKKRDKNSKKLRRSLSTKKSSIDEKQNKTVLVKECSVSLSPLTVSQEDLDTISELASNEIQELEKQIKEKRSLVDEFKQAEIIKKKHDLKELQELTTLWKSGCISALNDLLPLIQQNVNIDMGTLLKNLNIPEDMIGLSEGGDLI